jgi:hypothetical protein
MRTVLLGIALSLAAGCGKKAPRYDGDPGGFDRQLQDIEDAARAGDTARLAKVTKDLSLPDPKGFYTRTFGPEHADALVDELASENSTRFGDDAPVGMKDLVDHGYLAVTGSCFTKADDAATGYQNVALRAMKQPLMLCTARFSKPDDPDHGDFTLWSFAYVDGAWRMIGKTKALAPKADDPMIDQLGELPVRDAKKLLDDATK